MPKPIFTDPLKTEHAALIVISIARRILKLMPTRTRFSQSLLDDISGYRKQSMMTPLAEQRYLESWAILDILINDDIAELVCPWRGHHDFRGDPRVIDSVVDQLSTTLAIFVSEYRALRAQYNLPTEV